MVETLLYSILAFLDAAGKAAERFAQLLSNLFG